MSKGKANATNTVARPRKAQGRSTSKPKHQSAAGVPSSSARVRSAGDSKNGSEGKPRNHRPTTNSSSRRTFAPAMSQQNWLSEDSVQSAEWGWSERFFTLGIITALVMFGFVIGQVL